MKDQVGETTHFWSGDQAIRQMAPKPNPPNSPLPPPPPPRPLSVCPFVRLAVYPFVRVPVVRLPVCPLSPFARFVSFNPFLFVCPFARLSVCPFVRLLLLSVAHLPVPLLGYPLAYWSICRLYVCPFSRLFWWPLAS